MPPGSPRAQFCVVRKRIDRSATSWSLQRKRGRLVALVNCEACGRQISTTAPRCPNCGGPGPASPSLSGGSRAVTERLGERTTARPPLSSAPVRPSRLKTGARVVVLAMAALLVLRWIHGSGSSAERYFPLKQGLTWKYRISVTLHLLPVAGETTVANLAPRTLQGLTVVPQTNDTAMGAFLGIVLPKRMEVVFFSSDRSGIRIVADQDSTDVEPKPYLSYILKYPIEVGTHWTDRVKTQLLKPGHPISLDSAIVSTTDQVITPAGSFSDCIRVKYSGKTALDSSGASISAEGNEWYARDVGLVKQIYSESSGDSSDKQASLLELEEFKR
jgi:hypothetical protein